MSSRADIKFQNNEIKLVNGIIYTKRIKHSAAQLDDGSLCLVEKIELVIVRVRKFSLLKSAFTYPADSSIVDVFLVKCTNKRRNVNLNSLKKSVC